MRLLDLTAVGKPCNLHAELVLSILPVWRELSVIVSKSAGAKKRQGREHTSPQYCEMTLMSVRISCAETPRAKAARAREGKEERIVAASGPAVVYKGNGGRSQRAPWCYIVLATVVAAY